MFGQVTLYSIDTVSHPHHFYSYCTSRCSDLIYEQLNRGAALLKYLSTCLKVAQGKNSTRRTQLSRGFNDSSAVMDFIEYLKKVMAPHPTAHPGEACTYTSECVLSWFSHIWLFATSWTVACQASLSMGFSRQDNRIGLPCPPLGGLPEPGIEPTELEFLKSSALTGGLFTTRITWVAPHLCIWTQNFRIYVELCSS